MQLNPQDGVAALAAVAEAAIAPAPPTRVRAAAAAKTLLLTDMKFLSWNISRALRTADNAPSDRERPARRICAFGGRESPASKSSRKIESGSVSPRPDLSCGGGPTLPCYRGGETRGYFRGRGCPCRCRTAGWS